MNINILAKKCSGQSLYGRYDSYVTAQYCFSKAFLTDIKIANSKCHYVRQKSFGEAVLCSDIGIIAAIKALATTLFSQYIDIHP